MRSIVLHGALILGMLSTAAVGGEVDIQIYENADNANLDGLDVWVDVFDNGGTSVDFVFHNASSDASAITAIYFEKTLFSDTYLDASSFAITFESAGVDFDTPAEPGNPGGGIQGWVDNSYTIGAEPPPTGNGVDSGEWLTINVDYAGGGSLALVMAALNGVTPDWRIAMHIQAVGDGADSVWGVTAVPLPSSAGLALVGLGAISIRRRR